MKNILVLGSSGQVGKYLVKYLKEKGNSVLEFDLVNSSTQDLRIPNNKILNDFISKSDFIYFLAFDVGGSRYLNKYQYTYEFIDNNMSIMKNTFDLIQKHKKPFVFASSQMSNMSYSPYGVLKSIGEWYTKSLGGRTVKFWNVYGIEHDLEKSHVITDFILKAKKTGAIDMLTDGTEEREFLYAEDCCEALESVMLNYEDIETNAELHITSFKSTTILNIAKIISAKIGNVKIIPSSKIDSVQLNKKNIPDEYILKFWKPKTSIEDGISNIINFYLGGNNE